MCQAVSLENNLSSIVQFSPLAYTNILFQEALYGLMSKTSFELEGVRKSAYLRQVIFFTTSYINFTSVSVWTAIGCDVI